MYQIIIFIRAMVFGVIAVVFGVEVEYIRFRNYRVISCEYGWHRVRVSNAPGRNASRSESQPFHAAAVTLP